MKVFGYLRESLYVPIMKMNPLARENRMQQHGERNFFPGIKQEIIRRQRQSVGKTNVPITN